VPRSAATRRARSSPATRRPPTAAPPPTKLCAPRHDRGMTPSPPAAAPSPPRRWIAHLDMDAFYASVELLRYPELKGQPVVIGGGSRHQPEEAVDPATGTMRRRFKTLRDYVGRGVITTATYEARAFGAHSAMGLMKAARLCPEAVLLPTDFDAYRRYSRRFKAAIKAIA